MLESWIDVIFYRWPFCYSIVWYFANSPCCFIFNKCPSFSFFINSFCLFFSCNSSSNDSMSFPLTGSSLYLYFDNDFPCSSLIILIILSFFCANTNFYKLNSLLSTSMFFWINFCNSMPNFSTFKVNLLIACSLNSSIRSYRAMRSFICKYLQKLMNF